MRTLIKKFNFLNVVSKVWVILAFLCLIFGVIEIRQYGISIEQEEVKRIIQENSKVFESTNYELSLLKSEITSSKAKILELGEKDITTLEMLMVKYTDALVCKDILEKKLSEADNNVKMAQKKLK